MNKFLGKGFVENVSAQKLLGRSSWEKEMGLLERMLHKCNCGCDCIAQIRQYEDRCGECMMYHNDPPITTPEWMRRNVKKNVILVASKELSR